LGIITRFLVILPSKLFGESEKSSLGFRSDKLGNAFFGVFESGRVDGNSIVEQSLELWRGDLVHLRHIKGKVIPYILAFDVVRVGSIGIFG